jgi:hypothetical protein
LGIVDPQRHLFRAPSKEAAVEHAKSVAAANQPSQVVLLDEFGRLIPIAHYQLPRYPTPQFGNGGEGSVLEAAVKALLIGGLLAAGVAVLGDVVEKVGREPEKGTSKAQETEKATVAGAPKTANFLPDSMRKHSSSAAPAVFINCPFDPSYRSLFDAIVFAVMALGFEPRCALERDTGTEERLKKIVEIIHSCRLGIHDL